MARLAGKPQGLQIRYVLQAKWRISHPLGPSPEPAISLCCTSGIEGCTTHGPASLASPRDCNFAMLYKRNGCFSSARPTPGPAISLRCTSVIGTLAAHGPASWQAPGIAISLCFTSEIAAFLPCKGERGHCNFAMFYKRNWSPPLGALFSD